VPHLRGRDAARADDAVAAKAQRQRLPHLGQRHLQRYPLSVCSNVTEAAALLTSTCSRPGACCRPHELWRHREHSTSKCLLR
jgi:hypothetical protein